MHDLLDHFHSSCCQALIFLGVAYTACVLVAYAMFTINYVRLVKSKMFTFKPIVDYTSNSDLIYELIYLRFHLGLTLLLQCLFPPSRV